MTEEDVHLLQPGEEKAFGQSLRFSAQEFKETGGYLVEWIYENKIDRMRGNMRTLDGKTKALFGGDVIPHIWLGAITTSASIHVADVKQHQLLELTPTQNKPVTLSNGVILKLLNAMHAHLSGSQNESMAVVEVTHQGSSQTVSIRKGPGEGTAPFDKMPHMNMVVDWVEAHHQPSTAAVKIYSDMPLYERTSSQDTSAVLIWW